MAPPRGAGVTCGEVTCEERVSFCLACRHDPPGAIDAHCEPTTAGDFPFAGSDAFEHGCDYRFLIFAQCDGPEDCASGEICTFSGGEFGYARCRPADDRNMRACHDDSDCDPGVRCGETDPFGYFSPLTEGLGWRPHICGGASPEASLFCDRYGLSCGYEIERGFYSREQCLGAFDELSAAERACAESHLDVADGGPDHYCADAANPTPCGL